MFYILLLANIKTNINLKNLQMKHSYTFFIFTIIFPLTFYGQNLILNGGCENPGTGTTNIPDSWVNSNTNGIQCFQDGAFGAIVNEGSYAFVKNSFDSGDFTLTQVINLGSDESGSVFDYSIDYNTFSSTTSQFSLLIEALNSTDNDLGDLYNSGNVTTSNTWQTLSGSTIGAQTGTQKLRVTLTWIQESTNDVILDNFSLIKNTTLSLVEFENRSKIKLYPNPASEYIKLFALKSDENYSIYNVLGVEIKNGIIFNNEQIDIKDFSNGLYFLKLENGNTIKFMKK
jgi:hypothetical protein